MKVYLINLDRREDRLAAVDQQLQSLGMDYERIPAVDGSLNDYRPPKIFNSFLYSINFKKRPVDTEVACAQSHRCAWYAFLQSDSDCALILEDDVVIDSSLVTFLSHKQLIRHFDVINISSKDPYYVPVDIVKKFSDDGVVVRPYVYQYLKRKQWHLMEWRRSWRIFKLHCYDNNIICECDPLPALASGYLLSRRAAESFYNTSKNLYYPIDLIWRYSGGLLVEGFVLQPLITQKGNDSDIIGRSDQPEMPALYKMLRPFLKSRRIKRKLDVLKLYGLFRH